MVRTRAQQRLEAAAEHNTTSGSATLPDELLQRVLERVMMREDGDRKALGGPVRRVSRQWRAVHDAACTWLSVYDGVTDEVMYSLCGRMKALKTLNMRWVQSLTTNGLRAVGGLTTLTFLDFGWSSNVTNAVVRELHGLTALTALFLCGCDDVTNVGCGSCAA